MDTRYIVNHIKNEEQEVEQDDDERCNSLRYINSTYQSDSYGALNQKCLKRHYDELISSPFNGPGHQVALNDGGCFVKPLLAHHQHRHLLLHHHQQQQHPLLFRHQPSYSVIPPPPPPPSSFDPSNVFPADMPQHLLVMQEPKFPPQTFDIPDIQDSNSVFDGHALDPATFGSFSAQPPRPPPSHHLLLLQSYYGGAFYGSPSTIPDRQSPRGSAVLPPPPPPVFPAGWQQQQQPSRVVSSSTGSTDSSPGSQAEESTTAETASTLQQQQVQQPSTRSNGMTSSHSSISRLPKKKARSPKRRKRKDPNEPQKPVSAYSLFFRNAQAAIKTQNPGATFGDVSKIVASMWDGLDDEVKNFYKQQMEVAKKDYLKQLAIYRATLVSKDAQEKTEAETEAGINTNQAPPLPPTTPPVQAPSSSQQADNGTVSPVPAPPLCVPSMGFQTQQPLSSTAEPVGHHHHHHHHHQQQQHQQHYHRHMMSPSTAVRHPQPSPIFYQDGVSPCFQTSYASQSDGPFPSSSSLAAAMRSNFIAYGQKLDHESVMQRIPDQRSPYFVGMDSDAEYRSGEFIASLGNSFVNGLCREIPCRSFVESDEGDDQKLT